MHAHIRLLFSTYVSAVHRSSPPPPPLPSSAFSQSLFRTPCGFSRISSLRTCLPPPPSPSRSLARPYALREIDFSTAGSPLPAAAAAATATAGAKGPRRFFGKGRFLARGVFARPRFSARANDRHFACEERPAGSRARLRYGLTPHASAAYRRYIFDRIPLSVVFRTPLHRPHRLASCEACPFRCIEFESPHVGRYPLVSIHANQRKTHYSPTRLSFTPPSVPPPAGVSRDTAYTYPAGVSKLSARASMCNFSHSTARSYVISRV